MSYADLTFYRTTYLGEDPGDPALQRLLNRANDDIDLYCNGPLTESDYHSTQWENLQKANCAQAEFYVMNGDTYNTGITDGESIGKYSYSGASAMKSSSTMAPRAMNYLIMSGIMDSSVRSLDTSVYPVDDDE